MENRLKEVIAFVNNKGGVAKTTSVQNVAAGMLLKDPTLRILVIDLDPQCNLSSLMGWNALKSSPKEKATVLGDSVAEPSPVAEPHPLPTIYDSLVAADEDPLPPLHVYQSAPGLYYIPASNKLADADRVINTQMQPKMALSSILGSPLKIHSASATPKEEAAPNEAATVLGDFVAEPSTPASPIYAEDIFDYILIDCPPSLSILTFNALAAATSVLIPVQLGALSVDGIGNMLDAFSTVKRRINRDLTMRGLFIVMADERPIIARETIALLKDTWGAHLLNTRIRQCVKVQESQWQRTDIFHHAPHCTAAQDYAALVDELMKSEE